MPVERSLVALTPGAVERSPIALTRRQGLTAVALLGPVGFLTACSSSAEPGPTATAPAPATVASAAAAQENELVALYDLVIAAFPALAAALAPLGDQHRAHAASLDTTAAVLPSPTSAPASADEALAALIAAERRAMRQRVDSCVEADEPGLARTLAFIAASEGSHVPALRALRP
jgi:hypothetical protein